MQDLFTMAMEKKPDAAAPLADRMRALTHDEFIGQRHILGESRQLRPAIQADPRNACRAARPRTRPGPHERDCRR